MIHYKFKSAKDFSSMPAEGSAVSVLQLKQYIVGKMSLKRPADFDLVVSNPHTDEDYTDDGLIPKHSSVVVRRVPGKMGKYVTAGVSAHVPAAPAPAPVPVIQPKVATFEDDFGDNLYEEPQTSQTSQASVQASVPPPVDEEAKIKAFCDASASDWQRQTQQMVVDRSKGFGRGGRGPGAPNGGRGSFFPRKTPPDGYVCHRCNEPGHFIQHCPTNSDPAYNIKRVRLPTGIPRTMLVSNPSGSYALPNGEIATLRPNEELFEKEVNGLNATRTITEVPAELRCPLCKDVMKDAVLTSKCCFKSFCDKCIRNEICSKGKCVCGIHVLADDLLPNRTLREAIERILASAATTSSCENTSSKQPSGQQNIPGDMESAVPVPSPPAMKEPARVPVPKPASPPAIEEPVLPVKQGAIVSEAPDTAEVSSAPTKEPPVGDQAVADERNDEETQQQEKKTKFKRYNPRQTQERMHWEGYMAPPFWQYPYMHMGDGMGNGYVYNYPPVPPMMPGMPGAPVPPRYVQAAKSPTGKRSHEYDEKRNNEDEKRNRDDSERRVRQKHSEATEYPNSHRDSRTRETDARHSESWDKYYKNGKHPSYHNVKDPREHEGSRHRDSEESREYEHRHRRDSRSSRHEYERSRASRYSSGHRREDERSGILTEESNENLRHMSHANMQPV